MKLETKPFRHVIIDNFLPKSAINKLADEFPSADERWYHYDNVFEKKRATDNLAIMPFFHRATLLELNSCLFMKDIEKAFDMPGLIPDPSFRGGGLHQILPGGRLDIHADFNWHDHLRLHRRINAILYLNKGWSVEWGGFLELWGPDMRSCEVRTAPVINRMVVFETTDFSFHGHPEPLKCPEGRSRNSMAWYFYTADRPDHELTPAHSTMFQRRPTDQLNLEIESLRQKRNKGRL